MTLALPWGVPDRASPNVGGCARGTPKLELTPGGRALVVQASPQASVLGAHLSQCSGWRCCERLRSASLSFCRDSQRICHFRMGGSQAHLPTPAEGSAVFDQRQEDPRAHSSYSPALALSNLCFPG